MILSLVVNNIGSIMSANDILTALSSPSSRLTVKFSAANPSGETLQCNEAFNYIQGEMGNQVNNLMKVAAAINGQSLGVYSSKVGNISEIFFGANESAQSVVQQNVLLKLTQQGFVNSAKASGLDPAALAWGTSLGEMQATNQFTASGLMAKQYLPIMKAMLVAIVIGLSWLIAILAIMFGEYAHIKLFFTLMLWMLFWTPILVILNYITHIYVSNVTRLVYDETSQRYTLEMLPMIDGVISNAIAYAGNMIWLVPLLAYGLVKASEHGFVALSTSMARVGSAGTDTSGKRIAQMGDPTNTKYSYRDGNDVHGDIGGQTTTQSQSMTNGHSWNDSTYTDKGTGTQTYSGQMTDGSGSIGMVGGQVVNAQSQMALSAAHKNTSTASTELSNAISSSSTSVLGSDKTLTQAQSQGLSTQDTHNITEAKGIAMSKAFEHMQGYGEDFNNLKRMAMQGGGNLSASILDGKVGASGGVVYSGVDQDGKKYSWTDNSKEAEQNFNQIQEQFSKVVSGNSSYQASYAEMLKVTDSESYSQVQNAMTKLSNAEMTETGLNANNLPAFLNNWINGDERFSRMPKVDAAKVAMGELSSLSANGEWGKISDLVGKYGSGGFEMNSNPNLAEPTKFNSPDIKGQYDTAAGNIQTQTNSALEQSKANAQGQMGEFKQENGGVQDKVEKNVSDGKKWGEQGLFSRFWDENKDEMLVGAVGLGAALGLTSAGAKKIGGEIIDKFKGAKNVDELEEIMKKTDQLDDALKKNSPEARKLMDELGLKEAFEKDGGVFNKDGSIDQTKTKLNQSLGDYAKTTAKGDVGDFIKNNAYDNPKSGNFFDDAKKFVRESIDDAWKGVKNINPTSVAHGVAAVGTAFIEGVPTNPTSMGDGTIVGMEISSGKPFTVGQQSYMSESPTWREYQSDYNSFMAQNPNFNPQTQSVQGQLNNGQMEFNIVDKSDLVGKQVSDLQIQIKQLQKSSPSNSIPDSKGGKGEVL